MRNHLPTWTHEWLEFALPVLHVMLILAAAWLLRSLARRLVKRFSDRWELPPEVRLGARRTSSFLIYFAALMLILERFGVSGAVLWTAFTGFAAVAAVAFFAAWSVLSNIFCALLLLITRPFRLYDHIELLEGSDSRGLGGQVVDMTLIGVTLRETHADGAESYLRVPNSLFFQRVTRRWREAPPPRPEPGADEPPRRSRTGRAASGGGGSSLFQQP